MNILSIILDRGVYNGIPQKNLVTINQKPLLYYTINASVSSKLVTKTIVSSDNALILKKAKEFSVIGIKRPKKLATNSSQIELTIHHILNYLKKNERIDEAICVDASNDALDFGRQNYGDSIKFVHGTISNNKINDDPAFQNFFDLIIIDDVFGWVSRETLFQSITTIDNALADVGFLFILDFFLD